MKKVLPIVFSFALAANLQAQISKSGQPAGFSNKFPITETAVYKLAPVDNEQQRLYYENEAKQTGSKVGQYGTPHAVQLNFFEKAQQRKLPNGNTLYQFRIKSQTAISINVIFSRFHLAEGSTLYIFAADKSDYIGAYTSLNNNAARVLGTDILFTNDLVIELNEPEANRNKSELELGTIIHGFIHLGQVMDKALNSSGDCNIDVNCPQGAGWEICRNSVGMIMNGTGGFCSGALVNNTSGNIIPYFLTANHCGNDPSGWVFRFRWESPAAEADCGTSAPSVNGSTDYVINGGIKRASSDLSDFLLLELNLAPSFDVAYAGWDRGAAAPLTTTGIHHPSGDIKKISLGYSPAISTTYNFNLSNGHWKAFWNEGVTEGGSSGSPLFNQSHRVVGQLNGGASSCLGSDQSDAYGKFFFSWTGKGTAATRLSDWLDPGNTGLTFIDANVVNQLDPYLSPVVKGIDKTICSSEMSASLVLSNSGSDTLRSATITYQIDGVSYTYDWTGKLGLFNIDTIVLPAQTVIGGMHTFSATVSNPNQGGVDQILTNNSVTSSFFAVTVGGFYNLQMNLDCYPNETSWEITDANNNVLHKSPNYEVTGDPYTVNHSLCLPDGCFQFKIYDKLGDGMSSSFCSSGSYYFTAPITFDTLFFLDPANADFNNAKTHQFCAVYAGLSELDQDAISVYPNPFQNGFTVSSEQQIQSIAIYDLMGKLIYEKQNCDSKEEKVDFQLNSGYYQVKVKTSNMEQMRRLMKIN